MNGREYVHKYVITQRDFENVYILKVFSFFTIAHRKLEIMILRKKIIVIVGLTTSWEEI